MPYRRWRIWPITRFVLSPSVATTALAPPATRLLENLPVHAVPDDEAALPCTEARERVLVLVDAGHLPALPASSFATAEPTRPQPMITAFTDA